MKKVRIRDTGPEMAIRKVLYGQGLRYRVNYRPKEPDIGRSTIDIAFPGCRLAVFIDGCFWHCCPEHGEIPTANRDWWLTKFAENKSRDERITNTLVFGGWKVLRFWEHEPAAQAVKKILSSLGTPG